MPATDPNVKLAQVPAKGALETILPHAERAGGMAAGILIAGWALTSEIDDLALKMDRMDAKIEVIDDKLDAQVLQGQLQKAEGEHLRGRVEALEGAVRNSSQQTMPLPRR